MDSKNAIYNLELYKQQCKVQNKWSRNQWLSVVFDEMISIADEQIELYKTWKGRLQQI